MIGEKQGKSEEMQLVVFKLANEEYGLPIMKVQEINKMTAITKLPNTPDFMEGIINLRGKIIPVIDLRKRFGLARAEDTDNTRIVVVDINSQTVGIVVDNVTEVLRLMSDAIEPPPPTFIIDEKYIKGIGKVDERLVILLDIDRVLTEQEEILLKKDSEN